MNDMDERVNREPETPRLQGGLRAPTTGNDQTDPASPRYYGEYDEAGVDLSLLRYMLGLSPLERLVRMEQHARDTQMLYEYGQRHREAKASQDH
jgi:hypothetical protein